MGPSLSQKFTAEAVGTAILVFIGASTKWEQLPVYIIGPIAGGLIGAFLYEWIGHTQTTTVPGPATESAHVDTGRAEAAG
ncbi:MAG TPA: hypothetical protein VKC59_09050 [Candidatus Limnocylindrales bacterium]|nr:hypothetical protein [Candidatus Limnocylindrales bacterium]